MSKDFLRNMRDLQNCMDDFSTIHDAILKFMTPIVNFSNEPLSSAVFLFLLLGSCTLFTTSHLLPWRFISLGACWAGIVFGHPKVQQFTLASYEEHIIPHEQAAQSWLDTLVSQDLIDQEPPQIKEMEIFELQRRKGGVYGEWEPWIFSPLLYDPLSPERISGARMKGTPFFEDVLAELGWEWEDKKWILDFDSRKWVEERMVQGVEVELEGERWVSDLLGADMREVQSDGRPVKKGKEKVRMRDWEEGSGTSSLGEWRRRRWIRMARRKAMLDGERETTITN